MSDFNSFRFGFVGLGLIGGSIAKAIRSYWPMAEIIAYNPSRDTLDEAIHDGVVNAGACSEDGPLDGALFENCDIVFLCAPVQKNAENLAALKGHLKPSAILSDIGSTKRDIQEQVEREGLSSFFVGGHPMTGSERTRYHNSRASLLENAYYIVAPTDETPKEKTECFQAFVKGIKSIPLVISCPFHDYAVAGISHLPHVVSAGLVNLVKHSDSEDAVMHAIAAGGFKDITRIASSSPEMWESICLSNADSIDHFLSLMIDELTKMRSYIANEQGGEINRFFASSREYRDSIH